MSRRWNFYEAAGGGDPVRREILKSRLTTAEAAKLQTIMDRVAEGESRPGDVKSLRDGVLEVRVRVGQRCLRLAYGECEGGLILLALHFFQKQRQNESRHVEVAVDRFRDWKSRHDT
ncbi:type II toxin-antitoxin system RelE/ParE family toxin [Micromonospora rubida]|uniref:Type II toxin-antitoxin system RelE/ParE family toxin n=1 Tax=Micromonospora rubida TaxID=2697657 RepID=A0ABW7SMC9_9ACTN